MRIILIGIALTCMLVFASQESQVEKDVKSGKLSLFCEMNDGFRKIDKSDIVSFDDKWIFKNGSASNCEMK